MKAAALLTLVVAALAAACQPAPAVPATAPAAEPARATTLRIYLQEDIDVVHLAAALMVDDLRAAGYTVETTDFADLSLVTTAMAAGDLDVGANGNAITWSAVNEGAAIVPVLESAGNTYLLTATNDIQTCADLDGKRVAFASLNGTTAAMFDWYVQHNCPEITPNLLALSGGNNRRAALLAGEVDAVMQEFDDLYYVQNSAPGQFHAAVVLAEEFPGLEIGIFSVRRELLDNYRETVKDIIRSLLLQRRRLQDRTVLRDEMVARLGMDAEQAESLADIYLEYNAWPVNGDFNREIVQENLEFYQQTGFVPAELTVEQAGDWTVLEEVLAEIGRQ